MSKSKTKDFLIIKITDPEKMSKDVITDLTYTRKYQRVFCELIPIVENALPAGVK